jgi:RNAse (barnase) inhibitor barstar
MMNGDPTKDPLTQEAWDLVIDYIGLGIEREYHDYGHPNEELMDRVRELVEFIEKVRYNYMAVTMIMSEWRY